MKPFATLDLETDPFLKGRIPRAFAAGFYDGKTARTWNGPACIIDCANEALKFEGYVYLHNGGKFDLHFLLPVILAKFDHDLVTPLCIGPRIVEIKTPTTIFRDSYALIPKPLKTFGHKKDIEIWKLEESTLYKGKLCLFSKESDFEDRKKDAVEKTYTRSDDAKDNLKTFLQDISTRRGEKCDWSTSPTEFDNPFPSPREFYIEEINSYLRQDCVGLYDGLKEFFDRYGINLTLASTTFKVLKKEFGFEQVKTNEKYDTKFRKFYYAGRVQFFGLGRYPQNGELDGKTRYRIFDINSAFPWAMLNNHWHGGDYTSSRVPPKENFEQSFFDITCDSKGCLPLRNPKSKAIEFPHVEKERFFATGWEVKAGLELGLLKIHSYHAVYTPETTCEFKDYVNHFYKQKSDADKELAWLKANKEELTADEYERRKSTANADRDFAKLFLNSAYGKFALNPREFRDVRICARDGADVECPAGFKIDTVPKRSRDRYYKKEGKWFHRAASPDPMCALDFDVNDQPHERRKLYYKKDGYWVRKVWNHAYDDDERGLTFWKKPTFDEFNDKPMSFYNVCTAASITGCVRAYLQRAISACSGVLYCDTDSLIVAESFALPVGTELGQWKLEKECDAVWIGGKKLYAAHGIDGKWKKASKGVRLSASDIIAVCEGTPTAYSFDAPNYSAFSKQNFTTRTVRRDDQRKINLRKSEDENKPDRETSGIPAKRPAINSSGSPRKEKAKITAPGKR